MVKAGAADRSAGVADVSPLPDGARLEGLGTAFRLALLLAALASGRTRLRGFARPEELAHLAAALRGLGALVRRESEDWIVDGVGNGCLLEPREPLDLLGDPASAVLLAGLVAAYDFPTTLIVGETLSPILDRLAAPLRLVGAEIAKKNGGAGLCIRGPRVAAPVAHRPDVPSQGLKAALLLAGLNAPGTTSLAEPGSVPDPVERLLTVFGAALAVETNAGGERVLRLEGQGALRAVPELALPEVLHLGEAG
ncbi:3-phosphoshikimate 1-carboxyvinyltransferase [Aureimonas psammosilenae]|uniref:hypothetical protein n=1 Tax=Aureimonas psammosilenae TaxID=2495496 RepID=UPI0012606662|nr:hypothetical protein [Aureimonas psammosilenae]